MVTVLPPASRRLSQGGIHGMTLTPCTVGHPGRRGEVQTAGGRTRPRAWRTCPARQASVTFICRRTTCTDWPTNPVKHRALVLVLAYTGIAVGRSDGACVCADVEFLRRRISVSENAVQLGVNHAVGPTKGRKARSVPVPSVRARRAVACSARARPPATWCSPARDGGYLPRPKSSGGLVRCSGRNGPRCRRSRPTICGIRAHRWRCRQG